VTPGTTSCAHLEDNFAALDVSLSSDQLDALNELINPSTVPGPRYNETTQKEIDTEEHYIDTQ
jgi:diketogulonate reductase-like aldo/keto reductase